MRWISVICMAVCLCLAAQAAEAPKPLRALLLSGMNNHDWRTTTPALEQFFKACPRFGEVRICEEPGKLDAAAFAACDVIVSNWTPYPQTARLWPEATEKAFLDYMRNGGGFVVFHASACTFQEWPEFQQIMGLTWKEKFTNHTAYTPFKVVISDTNHPITRGLRDFYVTDELYQNLVHLAPEPLHPICTAFADPAKNGTGKDEPVLIWTQFGKGRGAYCVLGHDAPVLGNVAVQTLLLRAAEWAATGDTTIPVPKDWPDAPPKP